MGIRKRFKNSVLLLIICVLTFFTISNSQADVFNVNNVINLQNALTAAQNNGENDTINIASGTYSVTTTLTYFAQENYTLTIIGAGAETTILDGGGTGQIITMDTFGAGLGDTNCHITLGNVTLQNGLTISGLGEGGGLRIETNRAQITIEYSKFINNSARSGGGVYAKTSTGGVITIRGNFFINNSVSSGQGGGGVYAWGGLQTISKNTFSNNASNGGGGVYAYGLSTISENIFSNNNATTGPSGSFWGGGFLGSPSILTNNIFVGNSAYAGGGAAVSALNETTLTNNTFIKNAAEQGGGIFLSSSEGSVFNLTSNTIFGNTATGNGLGIMIALYPNNAIANLYNNVVWGNSGAESDLSISDDADYDGIGATVRLYNNDYNTLTIQDGDHLFQGNNIDNDPLFLDISDPSPENWDLHLQEGSLCIDAGQNTAPDLPMSDFEGDKRIIDGNLDGINVIDIGADEYKSVSLLLPNGVEVIPSGSTYTIRWRATKEAVKFKLTYSLDNGLTWIPIPKTADFITDTSYDWKVPKPWGNMKNTCLVKVKGYNSANVKIGVDISNAPFTIEVVKVTSPNGGEVLTCGVDNSITWTTNGTKGKVTKVKLYYTKDAGTTWNLITTLLGDPGSDGSYNLWKPACTKPKPNCCKVKVELKDALGNILGTDKSDNYFTIQP